MYSNISSDRDLGYLTTNDEDPTAVNAFKVFYAMKQGIDFLDDHGGQPRHYIRCFYPGSGNFFQPSIIPESYFSIAAGSYAYGSTVLHELGHAVMWYQMGEWSPAEGHSHWLHEVSTREFAFMEGWPTFFSMCVKNDPAYVEESGYRVQLEYGGCYDPLGWMHNDQLSYGDACEGRVITALWDLYDSFNESSPADDPSLIQPLGINCYLNNSYVAYDVNFGPAQDYYSGGSNFFTRTWCNMYNNHVHNLQELYDNYKNTISSEARAQALQSLKNNTIDYYPVDLTYSGTTFSGVERIQAKNSVTISSSCFSASAKIIIECNNSISILPGTSILENSNVSLGSVNKFSCIQGPLAKEITLEDNFNEDSDLIAFDKKNFAEVSALTICPNPFNPSTTIKFTIPFRKNDYGDVLIRLNIYNVQGKLIKSLLNNNKMVAGVYQIPWDGRDDSGATVSAGIYLCHLSYSNIRTVSLLILNK